MTSPVPAPTGRVGTGIAYAVVTYFLWGGMPLFFLALVPSGPFEIVAGRVLFTLVFCSALLTVTRGWHRFAGVVRDRKATLLLGTASVLIVINWVTYVLAVLTGHVVEAALGYFINPLITVLLGVVLLRERLRPLQWAAIVVSVGAVMVLVAGYGEFPWIALTLAVSFGLYGLVKKQLGPRVDAISGLTIETTWVVLPALATAIVLFATGQLEFGANGGLHTLLVVSSGIVTAVPLLGFAAAARRIPLVYLGLTQYLTPIIQFVLGVTVLGEAMPTARWIGFGLVWIALIVLTVDAIRHGFGRELRT